MMRLFYHAIIILMVAGISEFLPGQSNTKEENLHDFLYNEMGYSEKDYKKVLEGEIVTRVVHPNHKSEVIVASVGRFPVPRSFFLENYGIHIRPIEVYSVTKLGLFSNPPVLEDVAEFELSEKDLEALKDCKLGDCNFKITQPIHARIQEVDWSAPDYAQQANKIARIMIIEYMRTYMDGGNAELVDYYDQKYTLNPMTEFHELLKQSPYLFKYQPKFYKYLEHYPEGKFENVENYFFWTQEDMGTNHLVSSLNHVMVYTPQDPTRVDVIANKQIYASHYFEASLGITGFIDVSEDGSPGFYLLYVNRSRIDALRRGGFISGIIRKKLQGGIKKLIDNRIKKIRETATYLYKVSKVEEN